MKLDFSISSPTADIDNLGVLHAVDNCPVAPVGGGTTQDVYVIE